MRRGSRSGWALLAGTGSAEMSIALRVAADGAGAVARAFPKAARMFAPGA